MRTSNIFLTVDVVLFKKTGGEIQLLLIKRKNDPFKGLWALPGGFVDQDEDLRDAAARELQEETGITVYDLEQLGAFGKPHRDPRGHMVSITYTASTGGSTIAKAADDADDAQWFYVNSLPELAFDHAEIISFALKKTEEVN